MSQQDVQQQAAPVAPAVAPDNPAPAAEVVAPVEPTLSDLRSQIAGGPEAFAPKAEAVPAEPPAEEPAQEQPAAPVTEEETADVATEAAAEGAEEVSTTEASPAPAVVFEEGEAIESIVQKGRQIVDSYELPQELQGYISTLEQRASAPAENPFESIAPIETVQKTFDALKALARYEKDEFGAHVPNTKPVVEWLREDYKAEYPELVREMNAAPSTKYPNLTQFQEFLVEFGELDAQGLENVQQLLMNKGQVALPTFVPQGIAQAVRDAYWESPNRAEIDAAVQSNVDVLADEYADAADKAQAKQNLDNINRQLARIQQGIDFQKQQSEAQKQQVAKEAEAMTARIDTAYRETSVGLLRNLADEVSKSFSMFDQAGAKIASLGLTKLVEAALTDDEWAAYAQEDLKAQGIQFDWKQGRTALDSLYAAEERVAKLQARQANPLAIQAAQTDKANALKEIKRLQKDFMGQLTKKMVAGNSAVMKQKASITKKDTTGQRTVPASTTQKPVEAKQDSDYSKLSPEEIRSRMGELAHQLRQQGIVPSL